MFYFAANPHHYALPFATALLPGMAVDEDEMTELKERKRHLGHRAGSAPRINPRSVRVQPVCCVVLPSGAHSSRPNKYPNKVTKSVSPIPFFNPYLSSLHTSQGTGAVERRRLYRQYKADTQEDNTDEAEASKLTLGQASHPTKNKRKKGTRKAKPAAVPSPSPAAPSEPVEVEDTELFVPAPFEVDPAAQDTEEEEEEEEAPTTATFAPTTLTKAQKKNLAKARARKRMRQAREEMELPAVPRLDIDRPTAASPLASVPICLAMVKENSKEETSNPMWTLPLAPTPEPAPVTPPREPASPSIGVVCLPESPMVASPKTLSLSVAASPSPCRTFTAELGMDELESILRRQEKRMESSKRSTPARIAAMNRERRFLSSYSQQSEAGVAMSQASRGMITAVGQLRDELTPGNRALLSRDPFTAGVVGSWLAWAKTARRYGLEVWKSQHAERREAYAPWHRMGDSLRTAGLKKELRALAKAVGLLEVQQREDDAVRADDVRRDSRRARLLRACILHEQSESGKLVIREAARHWESAQCMAGVVAWMAAAQDRLLQTCLGYSARTHWQHRTSLEAYQQWRSKLAPAAGPAPSEAPIESLQRKARRLSLQSDRCAATLQRRRASSRLSLDAKLLLQDRAGMRLSPSAAHTRSPAPAVA